MPNFYIGVYSYFQKHCILIFQLKWQCFFVIFYGIVYMSNNICWFAWFHFLFFTINIFTRSWFIFNIEDKMFISRALDRGFEPWLGQTKDYNIGICCCSVKYAALWRKSQDWLARNQDNVSKWGDMSVRRLLFQWASTIKI